MRLTPIRDRPQHDTFRTESHGRGMKISLAMLVDSPSRRAHGNAASRLALGLAETGRVDVTLLCYSSDPRPEWLPPTVRIHRLDVDRVSRSVPAIVRYLPRSNPTY